MERKPDDPTKQCGAGPFHTASGSSCSTLLEIRTGEWLLKRHVITGEAWRLKWPQRIWAWVIHWFHEWIPFFGAFIDIYLKKETSIIIWILTHSDYKTIQINCCIFLFFIHIRYNDVTLFSVPDWGESAYLSETWGDKTCVSNSRMFNQYLSLWKNSSKVVLEGEIHSHQTCFFAVWNDLGGFITQSRRAKSIFLGSPCTTGFEHGVSLHWILGIPIQSHSWSLNLMDRKSTSFPFSKCFFSLLSVIVIFVFILKQ